MEPSNFTANCAKIAQFATLNNELREIHAILIKSYQSSLPNCTPTFLQQISRNLLNSQILRANDAKLTNFTLIPTNLLFYFFLTLVRQDPTPCLRELRESRNLKLKFTKMPLLSSLHNILTLQDLLQDNSLQLEATIYHCVVQWMKMKLTLMLQNVNFFNFRTTFKAQAIRILEN